MKATHLSCILISITIAANPLAAQDDSLDIDDLFDDEFESNPVPKIHDPFEGINRAIFNFNDGVYKDFAKPIANGYRKVTPDPVEKGIGNFFKNLKFPSRFASNLLQGRVKQAGKETGKFIVNSTVGLGGIFEVSKDMNLDVSDEDVGQAFGKWGMGHGFYFVMPLFGPTSLRDFAGNIADGAAEPIPTPWSQIDEGAERLTLRAIDGLADLPANLDLYDSVSRSSIDKYAAVRDAYTQLRAQQVKE